jgi:MoaA/NifB/PqqE/SkfB family radical SAM enzyme
MDPITTTLASEPPGQDRHYRTVLDASIAETLRQALRMVAADPTLACAALQILTWQKQAASRRRAREKEGLLVPPALFLSVTSQCNLACRGCYMKGIHNGPAKEMSPDLIRSIVAEACGLGVSIVVLAGGEPLIRRTEISALARTYPCILFPVFSNGLLIDDTAAREFAKTKNIVPLLSVEGLRDETDARRGAGVYDLLHAACARLKENGIFFGCSVTVTSKNIDLATSDRFIAEMRNAGARVFVFVEYVPVDPATEDLVLDCGQQESLHGRIAALNKEHPALFIGFPGDEAAFGGCLAAGRGFVHISPSGDLEACPAAPFSDTSLTRSSLSYALRSPLLAAIRSNHHLLTESRGGCALWKNQNRARALLSRENGVVREEDFTTTTRD